MSQINKKLDILRENILSSDDTEEQLCELHKVSIGLSEEKDIVKDYLRYTLEMILHQTIK
jgi:hypothetical protein